MSMSGEVESQRVVAEDGLQSGFQLPKNSKNPVKKIIYKKCLTHNCIKIYD